MPVPTRCWSKDDRNSENRGKMDPARKNGAGLMTNYRKEKDLVGRVKGINKWNGVNVVFDSTEKDQFENDLEVVARKGLIISCGDSVCGCKF